MKKRILSILVITLVLISLLSLSACTAEETNSYQIDVVLDVNSKTLSVVQETVYIHSSEIPTSEVCFNLYQNTTSETSVYTAVPKEMKFQAYPNGDSYGGVEFSSVKINGETADFQVAGTDNNFLIIALKTPISQGESVSISLNYTVTLANINSRLGYGEDTVNLGNFYPILAVFEDGEFYECIPYSLGDPFYSEVASYQVSITLPTEYLVASSGQEVSTNETQSTKTIYFEADNIRSFCMVCSDKFSVQTQIKNGIEINYYYLSDETPTVTTGMIANALDLYEESFGDYPYKTFAVTDANFFQGGMEYSALVMISTTVDENYRKVVIAHETAHQWWQTMVGVNEIESAVLDEGLTEYTTRYFFQSYPEYGVDAEAFVSQKESTYSTYLQILNVLEEKIPPTPTLSLSQYRSSYDYYALVYVGGHLIFEEIAGEVGEEVFIEFLSKFQTQYNMQNVSVEDFISFASENLGEETAEKMQNLFYP